MYAGGLIFRAGEQVQLFDAFEWHNLLFPADWHRRRNRLFLSAEVISYRQAPFALPRKVFQSLRRTGAGSKANATLVAYNGFCLEHFQTEAIASKEDHVFYLATAPNDVRGVEAIVSGSNRAACKRSMGLLLAKSSADLLVEAVYSRARPATSTLTKVSHSNIAGRGVFAKAAIPAGQIIDVISRPLVRFESVPPMGQRGYGHCIQLLRGWWLKLEHSQMYFLNHRCDANCRVLIQGASASIVAREDIPEGSELTLDYAELIFADDPFAFACACGSPRCRGRVSGVRT